MAQLVVEINILTTLERAHRLLDGIWNFDGQDETDRKMTVEELAVLLDAVRGLAPNDKLMIEPAYKLKGSGT